MKKLLLVIMTLGIFATFAIVGSAQATRLTYFGEDLGQGESTPLASWPNAAAAETAFLSDLVDIGTEDFESFGNGTAAPLGLTFPGAGTATLLGDGYVNYVPSGSTNGVGRYATSGEQYWETGASFNFDITFSDPVAAFGFYGIDAGDFQGQLTLSFLNGGTETIDIPHTVGAPGGSVLFFGIVDTENLFTSVEFGNTGSSADYFGFDDMTIASLEQVQIPDPSMVFLLGSACLLGFAGLRRKFKK